MGASLFACDMEGEQAAARRAKTDSDWSKVEFFISFGTHQNPEKQRHSVCLYQLYVYGLGVHVHKSMNNIGNFIIYTN